MSNTEWKKVKLGDICTCLDNKRVYLKNDDREPGNIPLYGGGGIADYVKDYIFDEELVLLSEDGGPFFDKTRPVAFYVKSKIWVSGHIHVLKINDGYDAYLITQLLNSVDYTNYITGAVIPKLNKSNMLNIELSIPNSIEEQRRIASLLSRFDELIQLHEFKAENLIKAKQQIMSDIFSGGLRELESINPDDYVQDNWVTVKLGDIFDIRNGYTPSKSVSEYWENGTIPWFRVEDIRENGRILSDAIQHVNIAGVKGGKLMPANSLILSTSATVGEHALVTVDCLTNQRFISCTLKSKYKNSIDLMYLFYCFYNLGEWCRDNADAGSTFSSIPTARVKEYDIKIPPTLEEQQKIANLLSSYDSLIELKRSQKKQVTNMKQQLMSQLLTNGGGQSSWVTVKLGDIGKLTIGSTPSTKIPDYYGGDRLWVTPSDIVKGTKHVSNTERKLTELGWSEARHIPTNSILITCIASIGKNCIANEEVSCNQQIIALTPNSGYDTDYLYYAICNIEDKLHALAGKATVEIVNKTKLASIEIEIPPFDEQRRIASVLSTLDSLIEQIDTEILNISSQKQAIMDKIFG